MGTMFYEKEYQIIQEKLDTELLRIKAHRDDYAKLVGYLVVAEDHRFYHHPGYDIVGICRAIYKDVFKGKREGASTIEQQLVRVLTADYRYSIKRKIKEIYLAAQIHHLADKYTLACAYLEFANYGTDYQGLERILKKFDARLEPNMDDTVCAEIVARLKYPEPRRLNPARKAQIRMRTNYIVKLYKEKYERR